MRIACIGNMNNNNFALMRYLRDLGADAHLLLFDNELDHFRPEDDTWELEKWSPFIHTLPFGNNPRHTIMKKGRLIWRSLAEYSHTIGSGLAPALLRKAGRCLDIFYPYSSGIEWIGVLPSERHRWSPRFAFHCWIRRQQIAGVRAARICTNLDFGGITDDVFARIGVKYVPLSIPMVYNAQDPPSAKNLPTQMREMRERLREYEPIALSHARHWWRPSADPYTHRAELSKRNDLLIHGFAKYLKAARCPRPLLVLFEYGQDVAFSRALTRELGIEAHVLWLPVMSRKCISFLLEAVTFGVGEFTRAGIWGGTCWECLAVGKPVFQAVNFTPEFYRSKTGHDLPPILDVKSEADIAEHLTRWERDREFYANIGRKGREWFNLHQGKELARRYLLLLEESPGYGPARVQSTSKRGVAVGTLGRDGGLPIGLSRANRAT